MENGSLMEMKEKCVFVVRLGDWFPEMCRITVPLIERWSRRIGADFHIISEPKFPDWPPNYERLQIYELGKNYNWNINIDADYIIDPDCLDDPTLNKDPTQIYTEGGMEASYYFKAHPWFLRDGRRQGIGDSFVVSSYLTHDIWTPLEMSYDEAASYCIRQKRQVSELCLSLNLARYGLRFDGAIQDKSRLFHLSSTGLGTPKENVLAQLHEKIKEMSLEKYIKEIGL